MTLDEWMRRNGATDTELATLIGVHQSTITRGRTVPALRSLDFIARCYLGTCGQVDTWHLPGEGGARIIITVDAEPEELPARSATIGGDG